MIKKHAIFETLDFLFSSGEKEIPVISFWGWTLPMWAFVIYMCRMGKGGIRFSLKYFLNDYILNILIF